MTIQEQIRGIRELLIRSVNEEKRIITYAGITETVASDGGILRVKGAVWDRFDKNPAFLWSHYGDTIGRVVNRKLDKKAKEWLIDVEYASPEVSEFADSKYRLAKAGFLPAVSVGFKVLEFQRDMTDKERETAGIGPFGWIAEKYEVSEFSLVSVGADPDATQRAIDAGEIRQEDVDMSPSKPVDQEKPKHHAATINVGVKSSKEFREFTGNVGSHTEALEANTKEHQRTQVMLNALTDEISGLTEFLERGHKGAEIVVGEEPDTTDADADERREIESKIRELSERVTNLGERNEQRDSGSDRRAK